MTLVPEEINLVGQKDFADPLILKFIGWLKKKKLFEEGSGVSGEKVTP